MHSKRCRNQRRQGCSSAYGDVDRKGAGRSDDRHRSGGRAAEADRERARPDHQQVVQIRPARHEGLSPSPMSTAKKPYWEMTATELASATVRYDRENAATPGRALTPAQ